MGHATRALRRAVLGAVAVWALPAMGAMPMVLARAATDRQSHTFAVGEGQTWSLTADVARVRVVADVQQRDVRIDITRHVPDGATLTRLPVIVREPASGPEVILRQADRSLDPAVRAEIVVTVPAVGSRGAVSVIEGSLEIRGYRGRLDASVQRGPIAASDVSGVLRLETTIGAVTVTGARLAPGGLLRLRAFNGDVTLAFAEPPRDARVLALALNGSIQSAIPLTMKDGWGPRWGETTVGSGEHVVSIDVVTGTIRLEAPAPR